MPGELLPQTLNPDLMEGPNQELETDRTTFPATPHQKQSSTLTNETQQTSPIISMMTSMTSLVKKKGTVDLEIFARILFSRIALKDIL